MDYFTMELSKPIRDFPNYDITSHGRVFNRNTGREMILSPTQQGDLTVGLMRNGLQYRRSVKVLVAKAFVDGYTDLFNTPIQLDGDRFNLKVNNIQWRPRWFAWEYSRQFSEDPPTWFYHGPILDIVNNIRYANIFEAATTRGILCKDIRAAIPSGTHVFPTGEKFVYI